MSKRVVKSPRSAGASAEMPAELRILPLELVDEPELPAREAMDVAAMDDLKASMSAVGLLSPIVVVAKNGRFATVAGHRRLLAARDLRWQSIRAFVYPEDWTDADAAMLHENVVREELNCAQEAVFFSQLLEKRKLDEDGLCSLVKRSPSYISERLKLLRGDEKVFEALREGSINFAVARVLNRFPTEEWCHYYLQQAIQSGTSSRVVEQWFNDFMGRQQPTLQQSAEPASPAVVPAVQPTVFECFMCGGSKDPYNLVTVQIHKWELAHIQKVLSQPAVPDNGEGSSS